MAKSFFSKIENLFPTPKYISFNPVAIDISNKSIKVMKLKRHKHGFIPEIYKEIQLEKECDLSQITEDKEINTESIRQLIEQLKKIKKEFKLKYVVASLPELKTYIFRTRLPKEATSDVASAIRFQLEENVPLKADEVNFDYYVIEKSENDKDIDHFDVVVTVFPKKIIGFYTKILKISGLFPIALHPESIAMSESMVTHRDKGTYLLLRLMKERVAVSVVEDGAIQYASTISVDMDKVLENPNSESAVELNEVLNKLLIFWFTNKKDLIQHNKIETAIISGDYALTPGVQEFLERKLKLKVEIANVWTNCFSLEEYIPEINKKDSLRYSVAIGLAIKALRHK
jgi:Tfp pilus assembly PilM family ATPase